MNPQNYQKLRIWRIKTKQIRLSAACWYRCRRFKAVWSGMGIRNGGAPKDYINWHRVGMGVQIPSLPFIYAIVAQKDRAQ